MVARNDGERTRRTGRSAERGDLARRSVIKPVPPAAPATAVKSAEPAVQPISRGGARGVAADVLDQVLGREKAALDDAFARHPKLGAMAARDRGFARILVATVLRRLGQIDRLLATFWRFKPKDVGVLNILRLGAAQTLFLHTPAHAAVGETVAVASKRRPQDTGMINAILRRVVTEGPKLVTEQDELRFNTPKWLWDSWEAAYGLDRTKGIALAHLSEPPLDFSVRKDGEHWAGELGCEILPTGTLRRRGIGMIDSLPGFEEGAWWIQDAAAALPARMLGKVRGKRVLDVCAAPGGKTAQIAAAGGIVTAVELAPERAERLHANLGRLGLDADVIVADALTWQPDAPFDLVLLDAPCTATGTIRRHPDIAWHKSAKDVLRLADVQAALLKAAVKMTAPGGRIVYAVCSLQPEEGPQLIERVLETEPDLARDPIGREELAGMPVELTGGGAVRTLPCDLAGKGGLDGFYICRLKRL